MRVLVACERSGMVRDALLALGHDAWSCDLQATRATGPHLQCDVRDVLGDDWDGIVAHPVCRRLTNAGAKHLYRRIDGKWSKDYGIDPEKWAEMEAGAAFFNLFRDATHIKRRIVENPIMHGHAAKLTKGVKPQYVQPWWFGDAFSKATGLHLFGVKPLVREYEKSWYAERGIPIKQECWLMAPGPDREEKRSQTYPGIARALAAAITDC